MRRLLLFLATAFGVSWSAWGALALRLPPGAAVTGSGLFKALYLLGGLGPAIGAAVAVWATPGEGSLTEFGARLTRWRLHPAWWLAVLAVPVAFAAAKAWIAVWVDGETVHPATLAPLGRAVFLAPAMVLGGGLEELGWRGVAQPSLERRLPRLAAALAVGAIWALWHLPLFLLPGAPQAGRNFPLFAADVLGNACLLAWVYARTRSILACVAFHAIGNTATAMGLLAIGPPGAAAWLAVGVKLVAAMALLMTAPRTRERPT
jgi:membrane protease YdiL (CAAX protease family)